MSRYAAALAVVTLIGAGTVAPVASASPRPALVNFGSSTVTTENIDGADRYATAIAISQSLWPSGGAPVVYLVSATDASAVDAGPAAARDGGVILYTGGSTLPDAVAAELARLSPARVVVVGGPTVVPDAVLAQVVALLPPSTVVQRVGGENGYETAAAISGQTFSPNTGATFHTVTPGRVLDSRISKGAGTFRSWVAQSFQVGGLFGVPVDAVAVTGNVTVTEPTQVGYVTVGPALTSGVVPGTSTVNFQKGDTRANGITVPLGAGGYLSAMYCAGNLGVTGYTVHVIFDVTGYFENDATGAAFHAITPGRALDSRVAKGATLFRSWVKQSFHVGGLFGVPVDAVAVTGNLTVVGQTRLGYVTVAPSLTSGAVPPTSTINFGTGDIRANGVTVPLGADGNLDAMYCAGNLGDGSFSTDVAFDVTGYLANDATGATFHAISPWRVLDSRIPRGAPIFHTWAKQSFGVVGQANIPADAVAVSGNVTIVGQTQPGYVTVAPTLASGVVPDTSTINFPTGDTRANGVTLPLGPGGLLDAMYCSGGVTNGAGVVQVIFDVTGYFANDPATGAYHASATVVVSAVEDASDSVLAGSVAASIGAPYLLISSSGVPAATTAEIQRLRPGRVLLVGDTASVPAGVFSQLAALAPFAERVPGTDTYGAAQQVAMRYFAHATTVIATAAPPDNPGPALVPLSVARAAPILYTQATDLLPVTTRDALITLRPTRVVFVGPVAVLNEAEVVGFSDGRLTKPADPTTYPAYDAGYHDPGEIYTIIKAEEIAHPDLVQVFLIGKSYEGRDMWATKISSDVTLDEGKPETLVDALHHADEHLSVEQAIYLLETLTSDYATDPFVARIVNERVTWIVYAVNPDGWAYDLSGGSYHLWRKNRQPVPRYPDLGTDINRNYSYQWACCGGSSSSPWGWNYHGTSAFSTPEALAIRNFVAWRVVGGVQRIRTHLTLHTNGELILYPYGYTTTALPGDMTADDHATFVAMATAMAATNGYKPEQSSQLYITDGDEIDWMYHTYGIFSFTAELYPKDPGTVTAGVCPAAQGPIADGCEAQGMVGTDLNMVTPATAASLVYPPYSVVPAQTSRNRGMLLYLINEAACPYAAIGKAAQYCAGAPVIIPQS